MKKCLLFIVLLCLLIVSVSGYTQVGQTTVTGKTTLLGVGQGLYMNGTGWNTVTKMEWTSADSFGSGSRTGWKICRCDNEAQVATVDFSWSGTTFTMLTSFTGSPANGCNYLSSSCSNGQENSYLPISNQKAGTVSSEYSLQPYGFSFSYPGGTYPYNGVYTSYSGSGAVNRTVIFTVKNLANQNLNNIPTALFLDDGTYSSAVYTNSSGLAQYDNVPVGSNESAEITTAATGLYSAYDEHFTFNTSPLSKTIYLQPISPSETFSNFTYHVQISGTELPLANAYIDHKISPNYELIGSTNVTGDVIFHNVPVVNNAWFYIAYKTGYVDKSMWTSFTAPFPSDVTINVTLDSIYATPTPSPTITQAPYSSWTLTANPNSINLGERSMLWMTTPDYALRNQATEFDYYQKDNIGFYSPYVLVGQYHYNSSTSNWDFRDSTASAWNFTVHDPETLWVTPAATGTFNYKCNVVKGDLWSGSQSIGSATTDLIIGGGSAGESNLIITLFAFDGATWSHLQDYSYTLTDVATGSTNTWDIVYDKPVSVIRGRYYTGSATKTGYLTGSKTFQVPIDQNIGKDDYQALTIAGVPLYNNMTQQADNTTVTVHVDDAEIYVPIPNAKVQISALQGGLPVTGLISPKYTGSQGEGVFWLLPYNTEYTVIASKDGYCGSSTSKNTGTATSQNTDLFIKLGNCVNITPIPTPFRNVTPAPTPTIIGVNNQTYDTGVCYSNMSAAQNQSAVMKIKNYLACWGFLDSLSQNMLIACLIILAIACIGGYFAQGLGFGIGAIIGATISLGLGLFPLWLILIMVILVIGWIGLKVVNSPGG